MTLPTTSAPAATSPTTFAKNLGVALVVPGSVRPRQLPIRSQARSDDASTCTQRPSCRRAEGDPRGAPALVPLAK